MRLMTWNIWHHFGPWQERQAAIEHVIKAENPDVLFMQEVHTTEQQAEKLAEKFV